MKKWIFIGLGAVLVIGASIGGAVLVTGAFATAPVPNGSEEEIKEMPKGEDLLYYNIQPEFVVNFRQRERPRVLMLEISVSTYYEKSVETLDDHTPELRNNMLLLLTEQNGQEMTTSEGKNALREIIKDSLNELIEKHMGPYEIEDVFFTRFVLQ